MSDDGVDLNWLLTNGAGKVWQYAESVQGMLAFADDTFEQGDYSASVEGSCMALRGMIYCQQVGRGYVNTPTELEQHLEVATDDTEVATDLRTLLPKCATATKETAESARQVAGDHARRLLDTLPFEVPDLRTPDGFFPIVGLAVTVERLREARGLKPIDWQQWDL